ncbi:sugar ABC transporter ATP-binding protein [Homoserinibacter sp. YIM 151385]|uniref:sugar ABC transporter ATP-binding protein n=1 Tax=Homoserinibacter sp. YIM 151385 TaxID=2985506 RepID=UPI0022F0D695|nr:sugar ABC transporter ATP-binding protein [Homoserinibacter sp. YIM 151385]WBU37471.1 sugar ABC transporter ATP-binding protein [Homoserinibacter sp. YIM 151385]
MHDPNSAWLQIRDLSKQFGGAHALSAVDLDIHRGEVHGLVGANGAGKSTLIRSLAGIVSPDHGTIEIEGVEQRLASPRDAEKAGLAFIHQELNLVPHFSAIQNILLGAPKATRLGMIDWRASRRTAREAAERIGVEFSLDRRVDELSVAERWLVMISKALVREVRMIAMDEPTASLSDHESENLFRVVRDLARDGVAILYVSHRLDEVLDLSDRITVFRDGRVTDRAVRGDLDKRGLIRAIVGREVPVVHREGERVEIDRSGVPVFAARSVARGKAVKDVSFEVHRGEVLGLGGLVGAGRTEVARLAFGADRLEAGRFEMEGRPIRIKDVADAVDQGLALVPEERRSEGLLLEKPVEYNMNIAVLRSLRSVPGLPFLSSRRSRARALELIEQLQIKTNGPGQTIGSLSGGNQQKALIGRWLTPQVKVLFLDEPSRGVDVGARHEIHQAARDLADRGIGTVVISSDVEELAALCDRVVVLAEGRVTGELIGDDITEQNIIELSYAEASTTTGDLT